MQSAIHLQAQVLLDGTAEGPVCATRQALSFWGGFDPSTGAVIDRRHELSGQLLAGAVLVMPHGKGSSTGSPVLLDALVQGTAPAAIVLSRVDEIIALGAIVAEEFYTKTLPILVLDGVDFETAELGDAMRIDPRGRVTIYGTE